MEEMDKQASQKDEGEVDVYGAEVVVQEEESD